MFKKGYFCILIFVHYEPTRNWVLLRSIYRGKITQHGIGKWKHRSSFAIAIGGYI